MRDRPFPPPPRLWGNDSRGIPREGGRRPRWVASAEMDLRRTPGRARGEPTLFGAGTNSPYNGPQPEIINHIL
eukprot:scaffold72490_cov26-Tisochrysis_lutea.AAC.4